MARVAVDKAGALLQKTLLELLNVVWAQPIVVVKHKHLDKLCSRNESEQIGFEIYSQDNEQECVHCQGKAVVSVKRPPRNLI